MDLENLLKNLPKSISQKIQTFNNKEDIVDIVLDLGRAPALRTTSEETDLSELEISAEELQDISKRFRFADDNR